jgi:hypothetical protein
MLQEQENVTESRLKTFQHQTETRLVVSATQGTAPSINFFALKLLELDSGFRS